MRSLITISMILLLSAAALMAQTSPQSDIPYHKSTFGVGLGIPYGIIGSCADYFVTPNAGISFGMGTTIFAGMGYNFGFKYFLTGPANSFRPRVSAYYGVNAMVLKESNWGIADEGECFTGLSLGIGSQWMWGKSKSNGLDFDLIYIATTGLDIDKLRKQGYDVSEPGKIKLSIGYRHAF